MKPANHNQVDVSSATTPEGERVAPSLGRPQKPPQVTRRPSVMDTLLGQNDLAAYDAGGNDPYNATGRQFRR
jgi:hypothetical protein